MVPKNISESGNIQTGGEKCFFGHALFGPWENFGEIVKIVYLVNIYIGILLHYTGVF